jgi:hypothetical protein
MKEMNVCGVGFQASAAALAAIAFSLGGAFFSFSLGGISLGRVPTH